MLGVGEGVGERGRGDGMLCPGRSGNVSDDRRLPAALRGSERSAWPDSNLGETAGSSIDSLLSLQLMSGWWLSEELASPGSMALRDATRAQVKDEDLCGVFALSGLRSSILAFSWLLSVPVLSQGSLALRDILSSELSEATPAL